MTAQARRRVLTASETRPGCDSTCHLRDSDRQIHLAHKFSNGGHCDSFNGSHTFGLRPPEAPSQLVKIHSNVSVRTPTAADTAPRCSSDSRRQRRRSKEEGIRTCQWARSQRRISTHIHPNRHYRIKWVRVRTEGRVQVGSSPRSRALRMPSSEPLEVNTCS